MHNSCIVFNVAWCLSVLYALQRHGQACVFTVVHVLLLLSLSVVWSLCVWYAVHQSPCRAAAPSVHAWADVAAGTVGSSISAHCSASTSAHASAQSSAQ